MDVPVETEDASIAVGARDKTGKPDRASSPAAKDGSGLPAPASAGSR
jgi:hypothetical protein